MKIERNEITISELVDGYQDDGERGVVGYGGILDIRPSYQREFVYGNKQRDDVIRSVLKGFPLNVMYWACRDNGNWEVLDGQQRTISICRYVAGKFSLDGLYFTNQPKDLQDRINNYELMVYLCEGDDSEKLEWFEIVNIIGEALTPQELRNAVYAGPWLSDAKRHFSRTNCAAKGIGDGYVKANTLRQELLEKALRWVAGNSDIQIREYMGRHKDDQKVGELYSHFKKVIEWAKETFPAKRDLLPSVDWGSVYAKHSHEKLNPDELEDRISQLLSDDEIKKQWGIYEYVLDGDERHLNLRTFTKNQKTRAYERQKGICKICDNKFTFNKMEGDHIIPWREGGLTVDKNLQMLCKNCNLKKSSS